MLVYQRSDEGRFGLLTVCLLGGVALPGTLTSRRQLPQRILVPERKIEDTPCVFCRVYNFSGCSHGVIYISPPTEQHIHDARYDELETNMCSEPFAVWFFGNRAPLPNADLLTAAQLAWAVEARERRKEDALTGDARGWHSAQIPVAWRGRPEGLLLQPPLRQRSAQPADAMCQSNISQPAAVLR